MRDFAYETEEFVTVERCGVVRSVFQKLRWSWMPRLAWQKNDELSYV